MNPNPDAQHRTVELNAAYEVLRDPDRRAGYNRKRAGGQSERPSRSRPRQDPTWSPPVIQTSCREIDLGAAPAGQWKPFSFGISNAGGSVLNGLICASAPWIEVEQPRFSGNQVTVRGRARCPDGPTNVPLGRVIVTSNGGSLEVPVRLATVRAPATLQVSPPVLIASLSPDQDSVSAEIVVRRSDGLPTAGAVSATSGWIELRQSSFAGAETRLALTIHRPRQARNGGLYRAQVRISSDCGDATIELRLRVQANPLTSEPTTIDFGRLTRESAPVRLLTIRYKDGNRPLLASHDDWISAQQVESSPEWVTYRITADPSRLNGFWEQDLWAETDIRSLLTVTYGNGKRQELPVVGKLVQEGWLKTIWSNILKATEPVAADSR